MDYYETRFKFDKGRTAVWKAICEFIQKYIPNNSVVIDYGSGYCDFINLINASKKIAIDINPNSKKYCNSNVMFFSGLKSILNKKIKSDVLFMSNILEHLNDKELDTLFEQIPKVINSNARLIIIQPNYYYSYRKYWDDYTHKKAFSHISICDFLNSKGFEIVKVDKKFLPYTMNSVLPKSYFLTKLFLNLPFKFLSGQMLVVAKYKR